MKSKKTVAGTTADPTLQFAKVKIDGQTYELVYDFNAIAEAERFAGCNLLNGLENLTNLNAIQLRGLLFAAMSKGDPTATIEKAGHMIRIDTLGPITEALATAYTLSLPKANPLGPESTPAAS